MLGFEWLHFALFPRLASLSPAFTDNHPIATCLHLFFLRFATIVLVAINVFLRRRKLVRARFSPISLNARFGSNSTFSPRYFAGRTTSRCHILPLRLSVASLLAREGSLAELFGRSLASCSVCISRCALISSLNKAELKLNLIIN